MLSRTAEYGQERSLKSQREQANAPLDRRFMHTDFETIRALKTRFSVGPNPGDEFSFTVEEADLSDRHCSAKLRFLNPADVWAGVWDDAASVWRDPVGFSLG
jgi:hypothetical protein